jgi:type I restriction enzyme S subunit
LTAARATTGRGGTSASGDQDDLPEGWVRVRLADVTETVPNVRPADYPDGEFGYVDISAIDNDLFQIGTVRRFRGKDAPSRARRPIQPRDVLFSNVRTYLRNIAIVPEGLGAELCSTGFTVLRSNGAVDPRFLFRYLLTDQFIDQVTPQQTGTHYPATSDATVFDQSIPLPPIQEQQRIVSALDDLLGHVQEVRDRLAMASEILKRFRKSVLVAACSGRLTEDWREENQDIEPIATSIRRIKATHTESGTGHGGKAADPSEGVHDLEQSDVPETWKIAELMWLCEPGRPITYGILKPGPDVANGVPYVRVADFPSGEINLSTVRRTSPTIAAQYRRSSLLPGDVLLSIRGTAGRVCCVPRELAGANITQDTARVTVHKELSAHYMATYLRSPSAQRRMQLAMKGVAVRGVNIGDVRALQIAVPPAAEQQEIVLRVVALLKLADALQARVAAATAGVDQLGQSILAKAFRGELVPTESELARREGREYEPAWELLERIRTERAGGTAGGPRWRRAGAPQVQLELSALGD